MIGIEKPSKTIFKNVGCGKIYVTFVEHHNGNLDRVLIRGDIAKDTPCGESWLWAMANLLTFALRRAFKEGEDSKEHGIIKQLLFHECNKHSVATEKSCVSAIGRAVQDYVRGKK